MDDKERCIALARRLMEDRAAVPAEAIEAVLEMVHASRLPGDTHFVDLAIEIDEWTGRGWRRWLLGPRPRWLTAPAVTQPTTTIEKPAVFSIEDWPLGPSDIPLPPPFDGIQWHTRGTPESTWIRWVAAGKVSGTGPTAPVLVATDDWVRAYPAVPVNVAWALAMSTNPAAIYNRHVRRSGGGVRVWTRR